MKPQPPVPTEKLDVEKELEQIARGLSEADAARVRTLIYLASRQEGSVTLPKPITQRDMIDRMLPLMRALGRPGCQLAYRKAWPNVTTSTISDIPKIEVHDLDLTDVKMPRSLKQLYKWAPEVKQPGYPRGYPARGALDEKTAWVRSEYLKVLKARKQRELQREQAKDAESPDLSEAGAP